MSKLVRPLRLTRGQERVLRDYLESKERAVDLGDGDPDAAWARLALVIGDEREAADVRDWLDEGHAIRIEIVVE